MQINNTHNYLYALSTAEKAVLRTEELKQNKEILEKVNNVEIKRIQEEIDTSSITGLGANLNLNA